MASRRLSGLNVTNSGVPASAASETANQGSPVRVQTVTCLQHPAMSLSSGEKIARRSAPASGAIDFASGTPHSMPAPPPAAVATCARSLLKTAEVTGAEGGSTAMGHGSCVRSAVRVWSDYAEYGNI